MLPLLESSKAAFFSRGPVDLLSRRLEVGVANENQNDNSSWVLKKDEHLFIVVVGAWFGRPSMPALTSANHL